MTIIGYFKFTRYSRLLKRCIFPIGKLNFSLTPWISKQSFSTIITDTAISTQDFKDILRIQYVSNFDDYPYVWLRDNCQCEKCFHSVSKSRMISCKTFDVDGKPKNVTISTDNKNINILWDDEHSSTYDLKWLQERSFKSENKDKYLNSVYSPKRKMWNMENFDTIFKKFDFKEIINEDECLQGWIESLSIYGIALITRVPSDHDSCRKLANRIDFIKKSHYGEEFVIEEKLDTTNVAYLSGHLQPHTDLPYYEHNAGVILLHCVKQALRKGGENLLTDGLYIANQLKRQNDENYKMLSTILVNWEDFGVEDNNRFHSLYRSPIICENAEGSVTRINFSIPQRGSHFNIPLEKVKPWYSALKNFIDLLYENSATFKSAPGDLLCIDNTRLIHGRYAYSDTLENSRYIIGAYLDWDFINSRRRVISEK